MEPSQPHLLSTCKRLTWIFQDVDQKQKDSRFDSLDKARIINEFWQRIVLLTVKEDKSIKRTSFGDDYEIEGFSEFLLNLVLRQIDKTLNLFKLKFSLNTLKSLISWNRLKQLSWESKTRKNDCIFQDLSLNKLRKRVTNQVSFVEIVRSFQKSSRIWN